jgi:hypothetical protein
MIGGIDISFNVPGNNSTADLIVRQMRQFWPDGVFQDADSADTHGIFDPWVAIYGTNSREFFIYRDAESAQRWEDAGAVPENSNTMLHFLLGPPTDVNSESQQITVVCDNRTEEIMSVIRDLQVTLFPLLLRLAA